MNRLERRRAELRTLLDKREAEAQELRGLTDLTEDLTADQQTRWDALAPRFTRGQDGKPAWAEDDEIRKAEADIASLQAVVDGFERGSAEAPHKPDFQHQRQPDHFEAGVEFRSVSDVRGAARTMIEKVDHVDDQVRSAMQATLDKADDKRGALARHMIAAARPEYRSAFPKLIAGREYALTPDEVRAVEAVRAVTLTDANGGYVVPTVIDPTIIVTGTHNGMLGANPIRSRANVRQIAGDNLTVVKSSGVTVEWVAEGQESSDNAPTLSTVTLTPYRANCFIPYSIEVDQDWPGMESEMGRLIQIAKDDEEANVFALGSGVGRPLGLITDIITNYTGQVQASASADTFAVADLYALRNKIAPRYQGRGSWMANQLIFDKVRQFDTAGGANFWVDLNGANPSQLMGFPAFTNPEMDGTYGSGENYVMVFGDLNAGYTIVDRVGMTIEAIPHLFGGSNNFPNGMRGIWAYWRTGGRVTNSEALAVLNVT